MQEKGHLAAAQVALRLPQMTYTILWKSRTVSAINLFLVHWSVLQLVGIAAKYSWHVLELLHGRPTIVGIMSYSYGKRFLS